MFSIRPVTIRAIRWNMKDTWKIINILFWMIAAYHSCHKDIHFYLLFHSLIYCYQGSKATETCTKFHKQCGNMNFAWLVTWLCLPVHRGVWPAGREWLMLRPQSRNTRRRKSPQVITHSPTVSSGILIALALHYDRYFFICWHKE